MRKYPRKTTGSLGWALLALVLNVAFKGYVVMISIGVAHAELGWPPKTTGYLPSVLIAILLALLTFTFTYDPRN